MSLINELITSTMEVKVDKLTEDEYSVRYYRDGDLLGVIRCKSYETVGKNKPIRQRVVQIINSTSDPLIEYIAKTVIDTDPKIISEELYRDVRERILNNKGE